MQRTSQHGTVAGWRCGRTFGGLRSLCGLAGAFFGGFTKADTQLRWCTGTTTALGMLLGVGQGAFLGCGVIPGGLLLGAAGQQRYPDHQAKAGKQAGLDRSTGVQHSDILWWVVVLVTAVTGGILSIYCISTARHYGHLLNAGHEPDGACLARALRMALATSIVSIICADVPARDGPAAGRCRAPDWPACSAVFLATVVFAGIGFRHGLTLKCVSVGIVTAVLVQLSLIDMRTRLLPDALTQPLLWSGLLSAWMAAVAGPVADAAAGTVLADCVAGIVAGYGLLALPAWWWRWRGKPDAVGRGDIKLLAALGAWLGPVGVLHALTIASVAGVLFAVAHQRRWRPVGSYPFGPFIAVGGMAEFLHAPGVQSWF